MKHYFLTIVLTITLFIFSGCASKSLSVAEMKNEIGDYQLPQKPNKDKAIIYIIRPTSFGGFIKFNVFLDSKEDNAEIGYTRANQYIFFNVIPGKHTIYSKAENWALKEINVGKNDTIFIYQDLTVGILYARNKLFIVDKIEATYHLKSLELGTILEDKI